MRVLVTWGSKRGGTEGIARTIAETLAGRGLDVIAEPAARAPSPRGFDGVVVAGALYANRWHRDARRYVERNARALAAVPTWLVSSGPLDDSADRAPLAAPRSIRALCDRIGVQDHVTFGGRLAADAGGFIAASMAKKHAGDWRNLERIRAWASAVAQALPTARPRPAIDPPGRAPMRVVEYGAVGWALPAGVLVLAAAALPLWAALTLHAIVLPAWLAWIALSYQRGDGGRSPAIVAALWTALAAAVDLVLVAPHVPVSLATSVTAFWLPLALGFAAAWGAGAIGAMLPMPRPQELARAA